MTHAPYDLIGSIGTTATLGLIVLQTDETIEQDFRRLLSDPGIALYITRIPSGAELTPEMIAQMGVDLPAAARLLPRAAQFDAVGYGCTSGTTLIGPSEVERLVKGACATRHVCNPLDAARMACTQLGIKRLGIVSPYTSDIANALAEAFVAVGTPVARTVSFGEEVEANVARVDPVSIADAARNLAGAADIDGIFLSCTNLRTLDVITDLEAELDIPVFGSNLALAWHMGRMAGIGDVMKGPYRLLGC